MSLRRADATRNSLPSKGPSVIVRHLVRTIVAVLGGCSLRGGEGSVVGILIGTALLQVLQNLVNLLGIPSSLNFAVMGAVILLGVLADQFFTDRRRRRQIEQMRESAKNDAGQVTQPV
jgi:ABC-type xylose transport system permease subunit